MTTIFRIGKCLQNRMSISKVVLIFTSILILPFVKGFVNANGRDGSVKALMSSVDESDKSTEESSSVRRSIFHSAAVVSGSFLFGGENIKPAEAAVGSLPEFAETNAIIQGLTVNVADQSQQNAMIDFLVNGFDFKVLRKRIRGSVEETVRVPN